MNNTTNLRRLRGRCHVPLRELEAASGLSNQYISKAELGMVPASRRLEGRLSSAMENIIANRKKELLVLEEEYLACQGRLLEPAEDEQHE